MKRGHYLIILFLFSFLPLFSQTNGNEWIHYDQSYYRLKISRAGIYRINKNTLISAGFPVSIDPRRIQLFGMEAEHPIFIQGESDGQFDDADFIEFYAEGNNGWLDSLLYTNPEAMLNPEYSLYNDTLCYYLTYASSPTSINNLRALSANDQNFDGYITSEYCLVENKVVFNSNYHFGIQNPTSPVTDPRYLDGEGYSKLIGSSSTPSFHDFVFNTEQRYAAANAPASIFKTTIASANYPAPQNANGNHHFRLSYNGTNLFDSTFFGYKTFPLGEAINTQALSNSAQFRLEKVNDIGVTQDHMAIGFATFTFPHTFNLEGNSSFLFYPKANSSQKLKIVLSNFQGTLPIVYSFGTSSYRSKAFANGSEFRFLIPQNGEDYFKCFVAAENHIINITSIERVSPSGYFTDYASNSLSDAFLIITNPLLMEGALQYKAYRDQNFNAVVIDINELYDQYGGGIIKHPLAIKRFLKELIENGEMPSNLFLLGKSISPTGQRNSITNYDLNLVPTIGYPPSDNLLSAGLNGTVLEPAIPTGRLAAQNNEDVLAYLDKVIAFEAQEPSMWMKNSLHFGGGGNTLEQTTFESYLASYENIIEDTSMGAIVHTYLKNSSTPIEILVNEQVTELINGGASLMTFFGHANGSGFDINIDQPENYENYGKYPLILASSCYTGNIHTPLLSNSENFVLIPEKGSIAYLASVSTGIASYLDKFNTNFYKHSFQSHYHSSIGQNIIRAIEDIPNSPISSALYFKESTCLEMTLHGDPSIILNAFEKPDVVVGANEIFFTPEILTSDVDSFDVSIVLKNIGRATHQSFNVELIRHFPGNSGDSIYYKAVNGLLNYDTLTFTLASHHPFSDGINTFDILVDYSAAQIDELDDFGNNVVYGKEYIVKSSQIVPVYPYDQSIIASSSPTFSAYAGNLDSTLNNYHFQLSQDANFSNIIEEGVVNQSDGVILWDPATSFSDHQVYYWRTAIEADAAENNWRRSSFEYITDSTGWGQSVASQFNENQFDLINYEPFGNELSFLQGSKQLTCRIFGNQHINENEVLLDLNMVDYGGCIYGPYIFVMVFDPNTLEAWETNYGGANPENEFGNVICNTRHRVEKFFAFDQTSATQMASLYTMLDDRIPDGFHVLTYTYTYAEVENWSPQLFILMNDMGFSQINVNTPNVPFIFYTQKGSPSLSQETIGSTLTDILNLSVDLPIVGNSGKILIKDMGKTNHLKAAEWSFPGQTAGDEFKLELKEGSSNNVLFSSTDPNLDQVLSIESDSNKKLNARISIVDTLNFSPIQFDHLRLFYDPLPDVAINANLAFAFPKDSLYEGEEIRMLIGVSNPTPFPMDSVLRRVSIVNEHNQLMFFEDQRLSALEGMSNTIDTLRLSSLGLRDKNRLIYEVNPLNADGIADQAEQNRFNNKSSIPFYVFNDQTNPIVDVTFDGIHIMNGEIISPEPQVVVQLKDNSEYLVFSELADTSNLSIFLRDPLGVLQKISYTNPNLSYEFGNQQNNQLRVLYKPHFQKDGKYRLIVQAKDKSGNLSGTKDYEIEFEIIRETAITQVLNYPNPFVDKTHFVFTLTGTRLPDVFTIRIYTATGKIVKEIHKQELGSLRIGNNITDYYWDGKDNYGDQLANGVYFYNVTIQYYDEQLEHIDTDADQYFKQGMGKMYLMR